VAVTWRLVLHVFDPDDAPPIAEGSPSGASDVGNAAAVPNAATS
jgi:hypothetical protein